MSGLYGNVDDYTEQLRRLETFCGKNPRDASAYFVLAYHYLVTGHQDDAVNALRTVVTLQPKDVTAKRMLDSLAPAEAPALVKVPPGPPGAAPALAAERPDAADDGPHTDLVGSWRAKAGGTTIELAIGDDSQFTWRATTEGQPPVELKGQATATSDTLVLENKEQGSMVGNVKSAGANKWQFKVAGGPPNDPGLTFERAGN
jgi:hypothetical protein